ncbi:MAG: NYN domain-containing protein [Planctomycetota bacterium]|nr:NYN domain-containing protein [Planctomycetota bacterium]
MPLLIDGYNLLYASGILARGVGRTSLERARNALLNVLAESIPEAELAKTVIVFDAKEAPWGLSRSTQHRGITIHFASHHEDADSLIEELILADSAPKRLTVVSSDHRLHRAANRRKARAVDSDRWFIELMRNRQQQPSANATETRKPEGPYSPFEVDFWLKEFGADPNGGGSAGGDASGKGK